MQPYTHNTCRCLCSNHKRTTILQDHSSLSPTGTLCIPVQAIIQMASMLAPTAQTQHQVEGGLLLDSQKVRPSSSCLPNKDQAPLARRQPLLFLDIALYILNGIGGLHLKSQGLAVRVLLQAGAHIKQQAVSKCPQLKRWFWFFFSMQYVTCPEGSSEQGLFL